MDDIDVEFHNEIAVAAARGVVRANEPKGLLYRTKCYLIGSIEHKDGAQWRQEITVELNKMGIIAFDPYGKPFIKNLEETHSFQKELIEARRSGNYDFVQEKFKYIRSFDLNLVDRSDFVIVNIDPKIPSWGSAEELSQAVRLKRPVFVASQKKSECPLWIFGMIPHECIFDTLEDILVYLRKIDSGEIEADSERWRLLKMDFR